MRCHQSGACFMLYLRGIARVLYVHKSSLQRFQEKTGYSVRAPKRAVRLHFAFSEQGERE